MKKIQIISLILSLIFISTTVNASVLGPDLINGYTIEIGEGATSTHNTWYSDQQGVGQQTENYVIYKPNEYTEPIITHGKYLYGADNIANEISGLRNQGITPLVGINADFFSTQTGVPMSNVISDGKIITKTDSQQYGIGILEDNTAFMSKFILYSVMIKEDGTESQIPMINKYRQPYSSYLLTNDFSSETRNTTKGIDVVLGSIEGEMSIGKEITATVESISENNKSTPIPEGKMVLTVDSNAPAIYLEPISSLEVGETIRIKFTVEGDERWKDVKVGLGATGDVLIENEKINSGFEAGAHPRTAIGIKDDGSILLYTIDGRQKGYSYGVQLRTLANRMAELGCIDAFNLDGGGSTSYMVQFPGEDVTTLVNSPSDGGLRAVSNFIFLKNNQKPNGKLDKITIYPLTSYVLVGSTIKVTAKGYDSAFYSVPLENVEYYVNEGAESTITSDGLFTAQDNNNVIVYAKSGDVTGYTKIVSVKTPTNIRVLNNKNYIQELKVQRTGSAKLQAEAYAGYNLITVSKGEFKWSCDKEIGTITADGVFTATDSVVDVSGKIYVSVGEKTIELPVNVKGLGEFYNEISFSVNDDNIVIDFNNETGVILKKENIIIKADGKNIDFELEDDKAIVSTEKYFDKLTVFVTNSLGYSSFGSWTLSDDVYKNPFTDTKNHWGEDILSYMYAIKIINGETTDMGLTYNPDKQMTRAEFASMITKYLNINPKDYSNIKLPYADKDEIPEWSINYFKALYELGIIRGSETNGKLYANPNAKITRAETATIISRTLPDGLKKSAISASDKGDIPSWAKDGFKILINMGAINGYEDGTLLPLRNVTKTEAAKILYNTL